MKNKRNFAIFILSYGRSDNVITLKTLKKQGYTGAWYILVSDDDKTYGEYIKRYGDHVKVFSKKDYFDKVDTGDNFNDLRIVLYARRAVHDVAAQMGITHFLELDDDYTSFQYRYPEGGKLKIKEVDLNKVIPLYLDLLDSTDSLTIAFGQGGDMIGGINGRYVKKPIGRKAMNAFFCRTEKILPFAGRINEDTTMYTVCGQQGEKIFTYFPMMVIQKQTQSQKGGLTEIYLDVGTYIKSFYSVMYSPSCVKVKMMGDKHMRIHHAIQWAYCSPRILPESYKKR